MRTINRISENDTIKAYAYDKSRKLVATVYDSGFSTVGQVIGELQRKCSGLNHVAGIQIHNLDKVWSNRYTPSGKKI